MRAPPRGERPRPESRAQTRPLTIPSGQRGIPLSFILSPCHSYDRYLLIFRINTFLYLRSCSHRGGTAARPLQGADPGSGAPASGHRLRGPHLGTTSGHSWAQPPDPHGTHLVRAVRVPRCRDTSRAGCPMSPSARSASLACRTSRRHPSVAFR